MFISIFSEGPDGKLVHVVDPTEVDDVIAWLEEQGHQNIRIARSSKECEVLLDEWSTEMRACKPVGVITLLLLLPYHRLRVGSRGSDGGRRPRVSHSARPCARPGRAARSPGSSASAATWSCAWPRSH